MGVVGNKCEIPRCKSDAYDVHHIKPVSEGGTNVGSNLIILCANHHRDAHNGKITKTELRNIVKKRSEKKKKEINNILRDRKKVGREKSTSSKSDNIFGIGSDPVALLVGGSKKKGKSRKKKKENDLWRLW